MLRGEPSPSYSTVLPPEVPLQEFPSRYTGSKAGPAEEPHDAADVEEGELHGELCEEPRAHAHDDDEDRARTPLPSIMPTPVPHRPFHSLDRSRVLQLRRTQELETGWADTRAHAHTPVNLFPPLSPEWTLPLTPAPRMSKATPGSGQKRGNPTTRDEEQEEDPPQTLPLSGPCRA